MDFVKEDFTNLDFISSNENKEKYNKLLDDEIKRTEAKIRICKFNGDLYDDKYMSLLHGYISFLKFKKI